MHDSHASLGDAAVLPILHARHAQSGLHSEPHGLLTRMSDCKLCLHLSASSHSALKGSQE